jgi:stage II sporulation protein D
MSGLKIFNFEKIKIDSCNLLLLLVTALTMCQTQAQTKVDSKSTQQATSYTIVRVLLKTVPASAHEPLLIGTTGKKLQLYDDVTSLKKINNVVALKVQQKKGQLFVNGKKYRQHKLYVASQDGHMRCDDRHYDGIISLVLYKHELLIINEVPLEEYICSVLRTESWPGWPLEVNKLFAITSRTYVISMIDEAKKTGRLYDVHNCNRHQTYQGVHDKKILKDAVKQTEGVIMTYNKKPIIAMFDSCCGGVVPADMQGVNFTDAPYLARTAACTYCTHCKIYSWQASFSYEELTAKLKQYLPKKARVTNIVITKHDKAGLAQQLLIQCGSKKTYIDGKQLYSAFKEIKSFCYTITKDKKGITFNGRGYGHHIGLCQWGAREMVRCGFDYRSILKFYYPEIRIEKLS